MNYPCRVLENCSTDNNKNSQTVYMCPSMLLLLDNTKENDWSLISSKASLRY